MFNPVHVISDGGGVQSSFLKEMADKGAFGPRPAMSIFADTKQEPQSVYRWMEQRKDRHSFLSVTVSKGDLAAASMRTGVSKKTGNPWIKGLIPAFVKNPDGTKGILGRTCTMDFKITPIHQHFRGIFGESLAVWRRRHKSALKELSEWEKSRTEARKNKTLIPMRPAAAWEECQDDAVVVEWMGISTDEADRAKPSQVPWIRKRYPLLEAGVSRSHCKKGVPGAPRTACKFCPFHNDDEWRRLRDEEPQEFEAAAKYESELQAAASGVIKSQPFLHASLKPLREVDFSTDQSQPNMFTNECEGMCGL